MKDPLNLEIPDEITVRLDGQLREGLRRVADLFPHEADPDLLALVIRRGLVAMLRELRHQPSPAEIAQNKNAARPGSKLMLRGQRSDPNHVPFGMKCTLRQQHAMDAEYDRETARIERDLGLADFSVNEAEDHPGALAVPEIHRYVGLPIGKNLQQELQAALDDHPGLDEEVFLASLLDLGLQTLRETPGALDPGKVREDLRTWVKAAPRQTFREKKAAEMVSLAERLYLRAQRRCLP